MNDLLMSETEIGEISLIKSKEEFSINEDISINVKFSILGKLRENFNEKN